MKEYLIRIFNKSASEYYKIIDDSLKKNIKKFIVTVNPESLMMAKTDSELSNLLLDKNTELVPDGIAIVKACKKFNLPITERITGIDISKHLLEIADKEKKSLYLFGAKEDVIKKLVNKIKDDYSNIELLGYSNGYEKDRDKVFKKIIELKPDVCLVALGIPDQEKIIYKHFNSFEKGIFVGVGGSFDVLSGSKKRAPKIFINLNIEWLYRIIKEPSRLKRFWSNNVKFLLIIRKEKNNKEL